MDKKGEKDPKKPDISSNSFLLPGIGSPPAPVFAPTSANTKLSIAKPYSAMTSSTNTLARNLFAGSSADVMSSSSRMYPVASLETSSFSGSAFTTIVSSSNSTSISKPSGIYGTDSIMSASVASSYPNFEGNKMTDISHSNTKQVGSHDFGIASGTPYTSCTSGTSNVGSPNISSTSLPSIFGRSTTGSSVNYSQSSSFPSEISSTHSSFSENNIFGAPPGTSQSKMPTPTDASMKDSVVFGGFGAATRPIFTPFYSSSSQHSTTSVINTSSSMSFTNPYVSAYDTVQSNSAAFARITSLPSGSSKNLFGGTPKSFVSTDKTPIYSPPSVSVPHLFGGLSATTSQDNVSAVPSLFSNAPSQTFSSRPQSTDVDMPAAFSSGGSSSFTPTSVPNLFGGKVEQSSEATPIKTLASAPNMFGGMSRNTMVFGITKTSAPASFGQLPGHTRSGMITDSKQPVSISDVPAVLTSTDSLPLHTSANKQNFFVVTETPTMSTMDTSTPFALGGKTTDTAKITSVTSSQALSVSKLTSESTKDSGSAFKTKTSSLEKQRRKSVANIFGGSAIDASKIPNVFSEGLFGGKKELLSTSQVTKVATDLGPYPVSSVSKDNSSVALGKTLFGGQLLVEQKLDNSKDDKKQKKDYLKQIKKVEKETQLIKDTKETNVLTSASVFGGSMTEVIPTPSVFGGIITTETSSSDVIGTLFGCSTSNSKKPDATHSEACKKENDNHKSDENPEKEEGEISDEEVSEKGKEETLDKEKLNNELLEILGKEDSKPASSSNANPQYDKKELTKIIIAQIPDSCMDKGILKSHFGLYGKVKRVILNPKSNQATVQYEEHRGASKAKRKGHKIHPNLPEMKIFYAAPARRKSEDNSNEAILSKKKAIKTLQQTSLTGDLDPYTPLERPSTGPVGSRVMKHPSKELVTKSTLQVKAKAAFETRSKIVKPIASTALSAFKSATKSFGGESLPKIRLASPKPATLKVEEKQKTTRSVSPAKEYNALVETKSLKAQLETQAWTSSDKYNVLKARDKLMRNEKKRTADINKATSLDAMCPDMCPELERYMRDVQNDIHSYEMSNSFLDHKLVVKKFSRSSADKEEPLPHELRPGHVLLRTMDFLVCNIMILCDKKDIDIGVWYNYLWDRTRAIRGDITQQQLTTDVAVTIIERCVRFHIFTDVHLCEESPDVFDRKLNTENLTKSLQTLKELYKDLAELGKYFPSECEFRAYEMLLNLNDGEKIVHQYSQYRDEVQKSPDVIYALKVFLALKSNNYIKFYKLIRSGTYLQGCILHRYFPQVRSKALDTYMKAYVVTKTLNFPLTDMIHTLGFENENDAMSYLNYHGLRVKDGNVVLDKNNINLHPEGQPPVTRPSKLIESNRHGSVVEVIQGGPIPNNPLHTYMPHNSFDDQGYLKKEARDASDQFKTLQSQLSGESQPSTQALVESQLPIDLPVFTDLSPEASLDQIQPSFFLPAALSEREAMDMSKEIYDNVTTSVIYPMTEAIVKESIHEVKRDHIQTIAIKGIGSDILTECIEKESQTISEDAYHEVDREEKERKRQEKEVEERKRQELEHIQNALGVSLCTKYTDEVIHCMLREVCQDSVYEVEKETWLRVLDAIAKDLPPKLMKEVINEEAIKLGNEVISELTMELEKKIEELQNKILQRKMRELFRKWRKTVLRAKRRKQAQATFPASCSQLTLNEQNKEFAWGYKRKPSENVSAVDLLRIEYDYFQMSESIIIRENLVRAIAWYPLPIQHEITKVVETTSGSSNRMQQYFKLLLYTDLNSDSTILKWLRSKLNSVENGNVQDPLANTFSFQSKMTGLEYGFTICEVPLNSYRPDVAKGASAILYVSQDTRNQMQEIIKSKPDIPHKKIICNEDSVDNDTWVLSESDLLQPETSETLLKLVLQLWNMHSSKIQIVSKTLDNFVSGYVASNYVQTALVKQQERYADGKSPFSPSVYIELYNAVIEYLVQVIEDEEIAQVDWPPPELMNLHQVPPQSWNDSDVRNNATSMKNLNLPILEIGGPMQWKAIVSALYTYVGQVSLSGEFSVELWSRIYSILNNMSKILSSSFETDIEDPDVEVHVLQLPWTEIIYACISYKLNHLTNTPVFYQPKRLKSFVCPRSWWEACDKTDPLLYETLRQGMIVNSRKRKTDSHASLEEAKIPKLASELLSKIEKEKVKYKEFQRKLEITLNDTSDIGDEIEKECNIKSPMNCDDLSLQEDFDDFQATSYTSTLNTSDLLGEIAKEKTKYQLFHRRLESMLEEEEDLSFLFKES